MEMVLRNGQAFVLPDACYGADALVDALAELDRSMPSAGPDLCDLDGRDVARMVNPSPTGHDDWVITLADMIDLIDERVHDADPSIEEEVIDMMVDQICEALAWEGTPVDLSPVCLEVEIEDWLVDNLQELALHLGVPALRHASLPRRGRQHRFNDGLQADLITRLGAPWHDLPAGTWVVIELKTGRSTPKAVDQLARYIELVEDELADDDEFVVGVLLADGHEMSVPTRISELEAAIITSTLTGCGYHDHRYQSFLQLETPQNPRSRRSSAPNG